jgi:hypothetical protein
MDLYDVYKELCAISFKYAHQRSAIVQSDS